MSLTCPDLYRLIFQTFYRFLAKREIEWWNSKFSKLSQVVHKEMVHHVFMAFWHCIFKREKRKKELNDKANEGRCNEVKVSPKRRYGSDNQNE